MSRTYERSVNLPVSAEAAFRWHERPGALDRLIPPWENVAIIHRGDGIRDGSVVDLEQRLGPWKLRWTARHFDYRPGRSFRDVQVSGPFRRWEHLHEFTANGDGHGVLTDHIEYEVPCGVVGEMLGGRLVRKKIAAMFAYRHQTTHDDLAAHARFADRDPLNVAITGASGLVGSPLVPLLTTGGHQVMKLVRRPATDGEVSWNPQAKSFDASSLDGIQAVVHLAGKNIAASRWTAKLKEQIRTSRVHGTRVLSEALSRMKSPPKVLACASAIGIYGDRGDEPFTEESPTGKGFLAEVARDWEAATLPAVEAGIRVVHLRFGVVLSPKGGALAQMLLPFRLGGGGRIGKGDQFWSWIAIDDAVGAIHHALMDESLAGPVNVVAPEPVTNSEFSRTLGHVLHRPTILPLPAVVARVALGEMADVLLLASIRASPERLLAAGYHFRQPGLEQSLRHLLGKTVSVRDDFETTARNGRPT